MSASDSGLWRILLVDDRPENTVFLRDALEHGGHEVRTTLEGPEALRMMEEQPPDFVLLDLEMPGMDGMEVLRAIQTSDRLASVIVIMTSAHPREEIEQECLEAGAHEVLSKPIPLARLRELLAELKSDSRS
jgi:CheY-like chemotaxis protein